ncbi:AMP-binding protein [Sphingosinicella rhizophila]|uniref:AMP-binding protein n=1 Tax=Sphingosinicella rhizophila TaxID=3050082 RepID=A0ABU3QBL2_9SPHN|nr:AMP-binding protein [Sphingosinicella sp. GR2756]MDT9600791.1 AMP-binding protein [Sphingosinicella sp. GR2756]
MSFHEQLALSLARHADRVLLADDNQELTGGALAERVERWASGLRHLGLRRGDRIAVQADKSIDLVILYLAVLRMGAVYLPLNNNYQPSEIEYFLTDAQAALFVCTPGERDTYRDMDSLRRMRIETLDAGGQGSLPDLLGAIVASLPPEPVGPDDLASIVYTSGTTGRSKGAMITHRNLVSNASALIETWGITQEDVLLHALPLFHIHGLFIALNTLLLAGGRVTLLPAFDAKTVVERLPFATLFMGVPTYYTRLLAQPGLDEAARTLRLFVCGSAPLSVQTFEEFERRTGHRILERYGMSECGIICSNPLHGERMPGAVGRPLPGIEVRTADHAPVGVLEVRGPNICAGYWRQPEKTREEFREDGFFITGDVATIDEQGVVRIVGREKDLIISGGLNIYPKEIEDLIDDFPEVNESAVVGLGHPDFGEAVTAVVSLREKGSVSAEELIGRLRARLASFKLPKAVFFVDDLPRNAMGKVQKAVLRHEYRDHFGG